MNEFKQIIDNEESNISGSGRQTKQTKRKSLFWALKWKITVHQFTMGRGVAKGLGDHLDSYSLTAKIND